MANDMADVLHDAYAEYCDGRVDWQKMVVAVHSFLGAEKPLEKDAVAKLVAALRACHKRVECDETGADILLKCTVVEGQSAEEAAERGKRLRKRRREAYRARKKIEAALRAAGEEVEDA